MAGGAGIHVEAPLGRDDRDCEAGDRPDTEGTCLVTANQRLDRLDVKFDDERGVGQREPDLAGDPSVLAGRSAEEFAGWGIFVVWSRCAW
jgi:hypothetical protein